jgi:hypothetical protein
LDHGLGYQGIRLSIKGNPHPTTQSLPNISFTAETLRRIKYVYFHHLVLDEGACRAIHDADLKKLTFGECVVIPNVAALQLGVGGPHELDFWLVYNDSITTPYAGISASLTKYSNVRILIVRGRLTDFCRILAHALQANTLDELRLDVFSVSMDEWKLLWETLGASYISKVDIGFSTDFYDQDKKTQAARIVADVMRFFCRSHMIQQ